MRQDLDLPWVVCEYEDLFPDELPGLPPSRDVDFSIELHPGTSPISMAPHRKAPVELHELKVQITGSLDRALYHGALRFYLRRRRIRLHFPQVTFNKLFNSLIHAYSRVTQLLSNDT